jgi:diaminopimelate decarboxylase
MHHFRYAGGVLMAEDVSLPRLAAEIGTPLYCYATATLERHYRGLATALAGLDAMICYALKANPNQAVIKTLAALGAGMDVVSEGELRRARAAGVAPAHIFFSGVGKTREEMAYALREGILAFNVESEPELDALSEVAVGLGRTAQVAFRLNPDVDARTHEKIATGKAENKFGVPFNEAPRLYAKAARLPGIAIAGIHMHIGSQITTLAPYRRAFALMREMAMELMAAGHPLRYLDMGGGLGVPHRGGETAPSPQDYAQVVRETVGSLGLKIVLEPGRMIVANAGILLARVIYAKAGRNKTFTVVDAAMNDLIRPTLYEAAHEIWPVLEAKSLGEPIVQDVVGPICESGDYLARDATLPALASGDLIAFMTAGAYGAAMSSTYNTRRLIPEVLVKGAAYAVVRPRQSYEALIGLDRLADWLLPAPGEGVPS